MSAHRYEVRVWDVPVRVFHWLLVVLLGFSWWSAEQGGLMLKYHMWSGYTVLALVLFRIAWGFAGSRYARFSSFLHAPRRLFAALPELWSRAALPYPGHNPLGGVMIVAMLASLLLQVATGLFANDDLFNEGPLYPHVGRDVSDTLTGIHHLNFNVLVALSVVHVAAVLWHRVRKGEHLVRAMITGHKTLPAPAPPAAPQGPWRAVVLVVASAAIVALVVNL